MSEIKGHIAAIERSLAIARGEEDKLAKGIKCAAPKLRAALLEIGKICSDSRKVVLERAKSMPIKVRSPKESKQAEEPLPDASPVLERQDGQAAAPEVASKKPRGRPKAVVAAPAVVPVV